MNARFISEQPFLMALESSKVVYSRISAKKWRKAQVATVVGRVHKSRGGLEHQVHGSLASILPVYVVCSRKKRSGPRGFGQTPPTGLPDVTYRVLNHLRCSFDHLGLRAAKNWRRRGSNPGPSAASSHYLKLKALGFSMQSRRATTALRPQVVFYMCLCVCTNPVTVGARKSA